MIAVTRGGLCSDTRLNVATFFNLSKKGLGGVGGGARYCLPFFFWYRPW